MTDTPRTDAESPHLWVVPADFAKQLERELADAIKQRDEARREVCWKEKVYNREHGYEPTDERLIAAERGWDCFGEKEGGGA